MSLLLNFFCVHIFLIQNNKKNEGDGVVITVQELFITDYHIPHIPHYSSTICLNRLQSLCRLYLLAHPLGTKITHFFAFTPQKV